MSPRSGGRTTKQMVEHIHDLLHHEQQGLAAFFGRQEQWQRHQHALLREITEGMKSVMTTLAELQQMSADNAVKVQANTDEVGSIATLVQGIKDRLVKIQADLDAALAAGNQAGIEAAADNLRAETASLDAQTAALDALKNTASDPNA